MSPDIYDEFIENEIADDFRQYLLAKGLETNGPAEVMSSSGSTVVCVSFTGSGHTGMIYIHSPKNIDVAIDQETHHYDGFSVARNFINHEL